MANDSYSKARTALLVIDPFNDFLTDGGKVWPHVKEVCETLGVVSNLEALLAHCRSEGILVVYVPHKHYVPGELDNWAHLTKPQAAIRDHHIFEKGSWGADFKDGLAPAEGDLVASPHWTFSGFAGTDLDTLLRQSGRDHVVICGMRANACVESTARYAVELGYHVTAITDAVGAIGWPAWKATCEVNMPELLHRTMTTKEFIGE